MIIATNPATGEELARYAYNSAAEVDAALSAAVAAQRAWAAEPVEVRTALLTRIAGVLRANRSRSARSPASSTPRTPPASSPTSRWPQAPPRA
jgi:succinate-semialdehyde dehydrogenase/glutarate-semialdehyde dehydrogenase